MAYHHNEYRVTHHGRGESIFNPDGKLKDSIEQLSVKPLVYDAPTVLDNRDEIVLEWLSYMLALEPMEREYLILLASGLSYREVERKLSGLTPLSYQNIQKKVKQECKTKPELAALIKRLHPTVQRLERGKGKGNGRG